MADMKTELHKLRECLSDVQFMEHLKLPELDKLLVAMNKQRFKEGQVIITQGEKGDAFYLVSQGKCSVWQKKKGVTLANLAKMDFGSMEKIVTLYPGSFFGEMALVNNKPRSATVKAETDVEVYILHRSDFDQILMANPSIATKIRSRAARLSTGKSIS